MSKVAILDYGIGNLHSAHKALEHVGADAALTADHATIAAADAVVLPGVGAFGACVRALQAAELWDVALAATQDGRPFLGVCVGMQMLFDGSAESPDAVGLGVIPGRVEWIPPGVKRPQMQWNKATIVRHDPHFAGLDDPWFYFVHSLHAVPQDPNDVVATIDYGAPLTAAVRRGTVFATQFHPEKSSHDGLALLRNFVSLANRCARSAS